MIAGNAKGIFKFKDYRPEAGGGRLDISKLNKLKGVPWETVPGKPEDDISIPTHIPVPHNAPMSRTIPSDTIRTPRRPQLLVSGVIGAGFTKGCPGCECIIHCEGGNQGLLNITMSVGQKIKQSSSKEQCQSC